MATALAVQATSGATGQPETTLADTPHTVIATNVEGEGLWMTKEAAAHAQIDDTELGLSRDLTHHPDATVHAQTGGTEPETKLGKPATLETGAHAKSVSPQPALSGNKPKALEERAICSRGAGHADGQTQRP